MTGGPHHEIWAASGAAWLTGHADGPPLAAPVALTARVGRAWDRLSAAARSWGVAERWDAAGTDAMALLGERAALSGLRRRCRRSCGGSTRLLRAADGWLAVALPRVDDLDLVPAWLGRDLERWSTDPDDVDVDRLAAAVASRSAAELGVRAALVGLAVGRLGEVRDRVAVRVLSHHAGPVRSRPPLVVDLSSLWAGPLCSGLLAQAGAAVIKVESTGRPDGLRRDPSGLFDLLTAGKRCVALDLTDPSGVDDLRALLDAADVVIEGSRPRALQQLGVVAEQSLTADRPRVWLSVTAHGRTAASGMRVGFGDDAAVAGGLVAWDAAGEPCFVADAVADPLTGLESAAAIAEAWVTGGSWLLDVALARVAAAAADGLTCPAVALDEDDVARPRARPLRGVAPALGAHTEEVLAELGRR